MEKIKKMYKKVRRSYRRRKLYKLAEMDASIMCGTCFHMLPSEVYIEGDKKKMLQETQRILHEHKAVRNLDWPVYTEEVKEN